MSGKMLAYQTIHIIEAASGSVVAVHSGLNDDDAAARDCEARPELSKQNGAGMSRSVRIVKEITRFAAVDQIVVLIERLAADDEIGLVPTYRSWTRAS
jgi:hypothetical protein